MWWWKLNGVGHGYAKWLIDGESYWKAFQFRKLYESIEKLCLTYYETKL